MMSRPHIPHTDKPGLIPDETMESAGRKIFVYYLSRMLKHEKAVRHSDDPDGIHDMRVATRRLRSALSTFEDFYRRSVVKDYRKGLKDVAGALGAIRDLDVIQAAGQSYTKSLDKAAQEAIQGL